MLARLETLRKGSEGLPQAYDDALCRIDGQMAGHRDLARRALTWLTYARIPLQTQELLHALAIEVGETAIDSDDIDDADSIISFCAGLITVDKESSIIRLVHYTTQEYLANIRSQNHA
jgi:hypothetical protein